eukprot:745596_1
MIDRLPTDILFRIISFDIAMATNIYVLNQAMYYVSHSDPNFNALVKSKFGPMVQWTVQNADIPRNISTALNAVNVANTVCEIKEIVYIAIGHPQYSLNAYVSILLPFGCALNRQIRQLQLKMTAAVSMQTKQSNGTIQDDDEFISAWYELEHCTQIMYRRIRFWLTLQHKMEPHIEDIKHCSNNWQAKLEWVLMR